MEVQAPKEKYLFPTNINYAPTTARATDLVTSLMELGV